MHGISVVLILGIQDLKFTNNYTFIGKIRKQGLLVCVVTFFQMALFPAKLVF